MSAVSLDARVEVSSQVPIAAVYSPAHDLAIDRSGPAELTATFAASMPGSQALAAALAAISEVNSDVNAMTGGGVQVTLEQAAVKELGDSLRGRLLLPGAEGYNAARRVLNPVIDKHPALVVQPSGAADIMSAVTFARVNNKSIGKVLMEEHELP